MYIKYGVCDKHGNFIEHDQDQLSAQNLVSSLNRQDPDRGWTMIIESM